MDGAGYKESQSVIYFLNGLKKIASDLPVKFTSLTEGFRWPQGDHSIFAQNRRPVIAISSEWFIHNIDVQEITHTPKENREIVIREKLIEIMLGIKYLVEQLTA